MKETIKNLKKTTGHKTDKAFAEFVGVTENTITRAKAGYKTKIGKALVLIECLISAVPRGKLKTLLATFSINSNKDGKNQDEQ